jgi:hypothetical protein
MTRTREENAADLAGKEADYSSESERIAKTERIAQLNDEFRKTFVGGRVVLTHGIASLSDIEREAIILEVRLFDKFKQPNNPYGERDFGTFNTPSGLQIYWKIDYYDANLDFGSEDPADSTVTTRVLTILLADEY